jgi:tRNA(Ile)-lysidine synthase TilS/MesJ
MNHLNDEKVLIGLSAGINSMAILCYMKEQGIQPKELHLFYAHFREHSPDSARFVIDGIRFAKKHFKKCYCKN